MNFENFEFKSKDGTKIVGYKWIPKNGKLKGVVQISHGMAEHAARYDEFANVLGKVGYVVYSSDHRGHGKTAGSLNNVGYFADENGWDLVVDDLYAVTKIAKSAYPNLPLFFFAHSMGELFGRDFISIHHKDLKGVILSATGGDPGLLGIISRIVGGFITKSEAKKKGKKFPSKLNQMSFGNFNNAFKPNRTDFDWLSRDEKEVDKYIADPYCGFICSTGHFIDLLKGIELINSTENINKIPKDLPIYFFAGDLDPVGNNSKTVTKVFNAYKKAGIKDLELKFYKNARHETLNEINRKEVFADVISWLDKH